VQLDDISALLSDVEFTYSSMIADNPKYDNL